MSPRSLPPPASPDVTFVADGPDSIPASTTTMGSSRLGWALAFATLLAATALFWGFDALPFQDLPAHAGLIALRRRFASSPFDHQYFVYAPHLGPYSLFRTLGDAFAGLVGPIGAVRILGAFPLAAIPGGVVFARWRLFGRAHPSHFIAALLLTLGFMTLLGFASYLTGFAVALFAFTVWLELLEAVERGERSWKKELLVACLAPLVFVAHGHAFMLFMLLAGTSALATGSRRARILRLRAFIPAVLLVASVAWIERASHLPFGAARAPQPSLSPVFQGPIDKLSLLLTPTLMTRTGVDAAACLLLWTTAILGIVTAVRARRTLSPTARRHTMAIATCAAAVSLAFLVLPHTFGWFGFVDGRLVPLFLVLAVLTTDPAKLGSVGRTLFARALPVSAVFAVAIGLYASYRFQDEATGYREVLARVPAGARLLNMPLEPNSRFFTAHPFIHYDKLVMVDRPVVVSDVWYHQGTALYPTAQNPSLRLPASYSESDLHAVDWASFTLNDWDYVLVRTWPEAHETGLPSSLTLIEHRGGWWLYARAGATSSR